MTGLRAKNLGVSYARLVALRDIDLDLEPGRFLAVTGPSGAGKSSLLWALGGAVTPSEGQVSLDGTRIVDREQAAGLGVVMVPQGNALASALTARENALVPLLAAGVDPRRGGGADRGGPGPGRAGRVRWAPDRGAVRWSAAARGPGSRLRGPCRGALADEPTSDLDATNRERMIAALQGEAARGAVVVMSTHDPEAAAQADAQAALDAGAMHWVRRASRPPRKSKDPLRAGR